jgi:hypothetical protein
VLSVPIVLPSATSAPSLHAAALLTAEEPLALRCGATGAVRCLLVIPPVWGTSGDTAAGSAAADDGIEDIGEPAADDGQEAEEEVLQELAIDSYSAVELTAGADMQLAVSTEQKLDGFRPLVAPSCLDLKAGAVVLSSVHQRSLSLVRDTSGANDNQQVVDPHAHVFEWQEKTGSAGSTGGEDAGALLKHVGFVGALGYICSARPQRRFVALSPQRRYAVVAEGKLVTVFATAAGP